MAVHSFILFTLITYRRDFTIIFRYAWVEYNLMLPTLQDKLTFYFQSISYAVHPHTFL